MSIEQELLQYGITTTLEKLYKNKNAYKKYEYLNCLERWALSLAVRSGTCVYYKTDINDLINQKLTGELKDKKLPPLVKDGYS